MATSGERWSIGLLPRAERSTSLLHLTISSMYAPPISTICAGESTHCYVGGDTEHNQFSILTKIEAAIEARNRASHLVTQLGFLAPLSLLSEHSRIGDRPNLLSYCRISPPFRLSIHHSNLASFQCRVGSDPRNGRISNRTFRICCTQIPGRR